MAVDIAAVTRRNPRRSASAAHVLDQLFRSGTAIGASLEEGQVALSRRDMAAKYVIALREARETEYWAKILATEPDLAEDAHRIGREAGEFVAMLTVSVKKLRQDR